MSPKAPIIALLLLGIGYVIGLPLGRMSAWRAVPPTVLSDSSDKSARHQRTARQTERGRDRAQRALSAGLQAARHTGSAHRGLGRGSGHLSIPLWFALNGVRAPRQAAISAAPAA